MALRAHQQTNSDQLIKILGRHGAALDSSDTGTGKSYTAVSVIQKLGARPAIVCPMACIPAWKHVCHEFGVEPFFVANYEACRAGSFKFGGFAHKGAYTQYRWTPDGRVVFIWDEVQRCKDRESLNSKMLLSATNRYKNLLLSATPFTTPLEAYSIGSALRLFEQSKYTNWMFKHGVRRNPNFGGFVFRGDHTNMENIHREVFPEHGVRTRRCEIPGFPETLILTECVETGSADTIERVYLEEIEQSRAADQKRVWDKFEERARELGYFDDLPADWREDVTPLAITDDLRARQEAELLKCPVIVEMARDAVSKGESVSIFVNFDATIGVLGKRLKTSCVLRGRRKGDAGDCSESVRAFQANEEPYILVNNQAGGVGVSLHDPITQKPRMALISPPWSALTLRQVFGRVNRDSGGYSTQKLLFASGTIEERVMKRVQSRMDNLDALTDGDLDPLIL